MRIGKLADLQCDAGWNLLYTVPKGENGVVSLNFSSLDCNSVVFQVRHVKQGNQGSVQHEAKHTISTPYLLSTENMAIKDLGVDSLDDIWVSASKDNYLIASVNSQGNS